MLGNSSYTRRMARLWARRRKAEREFLANGGKRCCGTCRLGWRCPTDREDVCAMWELRVEEARSQIVTSRQEIQDGYPHAL